MDNNTSELNQPMWCLISSRGIELINVTYDEAAEKCKELAAQDVHGLCVVTLNAAWREGISRYAAKNN